MKNFKEMYEELAREINSLDKKLKVVVNFNERNISNKMIQIEKDIIRKIGRFYGKLDMLNRCETIVKETIEKLKSHVEIQAEQTKRKLDFKNDTPQGVFDKDTIRFLEYLEDFKQRLGMSDSESDVQISDKELK